MKLHQKERLRLSILFLMGFLLFGNATGYADDQKKMDSQPAGTYIELTESFYRALQNEPSGGDRVYGNTPPSDDYLRQIAISTKFMVETNLQIIRQQEKMIELLSGKRGK